MGSTLSKIIRESATLGEPMKYSSRLMATRNTCTLWWTMKHDSGLRKKLRTQRTLLMFSTIPTWKKDCGEEAHILITDGAPNFDAGLKEFHTRTTALTSSHSPNPFNWTTITTRWKGSTGKSETVKRSSQPQENRQSPIKGYQIYHNYVRPHMGLDGKTQQTSQE